MTSSARDWLEEWRPSPEAPGYEASSWGRVRSAAGQILKANPQRSGHLTVSVKINGAWTSRQVGAVVCAAFHGPRPEGHEADHRNTQRPDNSAANMRWLPIPINRAIALHKRGARRAGAKLTQEQVDEIRAVFRAHDRKGRSGRALAKRFGVSPPTVMAIVQLRRWNPERPRQLQELRESLK